MGVGEVMVLAMAVVGPGGLALGRRKVAAGKEHGAHTGAGASGDPGRGSRSVEGGAAMGVIFFT